MNVSEQSLQKRSAAPAETGPRSEKKKRGRRAGPGRPEGPSTLRDDILDVAEEVFAEAGYAGTSLRVVAERAKVTQALISYYFGSKYGLFTEVFLRRSRKVSDERVERLAALRASGEPLKVEDVVRAFLTPTLAMRATPQGRTFLRLQARLHTEPPEISYALRNEAYDDSTRAFADAFMETLPHLSAKDVYWRMTMMIGAYLYIFSDTHRLDELAPGICNPDDADEMLQVISTFVTAGMTAPA